MNQLWRYRCCEGSEESPGCQKMCRKCGQPWGSLAGRCYKRPHTLTSKKAESVQLWWRKVFRYESGECFTVRAKSVWLWRQKVFRYEGWECFNNEVRECLTEGGECLARKAESVWLWRQRVSNYEWWDCLTMKVESVWQWWRRVFNYEGRDVQQGRRRNIWKIRLKRRRLVIWDHFYKL